jgi:5-(carboxyamino)imidazole ribonucleotide synthase
VIVARSRSGEIRCYDPAENVHRDGILHTSTLPAKISTHTEQSAIEIASKIVTALDYVGVMGVEYFVATDGGLIVNEIAPRVHNSGHWTEAACAISQFEQHIRAVSGWPLANPTRHSDCIMENLIGDDILKMPNLLSLTDVSIHLYGKSESRPGRKMGHFTQLQKSK